MTRALAFAWAVLALVCVAAGAVFKLEADRFLDETRFSSSFGTGSGHLTAQTVSGVTSLNMTPFAAIATVVVGAIFVLLLAHARRWRPRPERDRPGR